KYRGCVLFLKKATADRSPFTRCRLRITSIKKSFVFFLDKGGAPGLCMEVWIDAQSQYIT
uniref:Uncharacterized protein n=1 Tax=Triticum urartu TaxID=4572 RepID=A0A8R7UJ51_TRIUA